MENSVVQSDPNGSIQHEYYAELCALATSGTLTDQEWCRLTAHLPYCGDCRRLVQEYREISRTGIALLMPDKIADDGAGPQGSWSPELAKQELFARIARGDTVVERNAGAYARTGPARARFWRWVFPPIPQLALRYAAATVFVLALTVSAYRIGTIKGQASIDAQGNLSASEVDSLRAQLARLTQERTAADDRLKGQRMEFESVSGQLQTQIAEVERLKTLQGKTAQALQEGASTAAELRSQYTSVAADREGINRKLQEAEAALQAVQQRLDGLRQGRAVELLHTADLENRIQDLSARLKESEAASQQQQQFLASDRDIRELMGARQLYIADVFDVNGRGETQKPFGRVFYTKSKSLIFYAFDLDHQPHVRNANIFQAWGRRGLGDKQPVNMGIFYLDSQTNKRWVLKFDDPQALAEVDAVFVTVEPHGGSQKPSGKQLLFASLRSVPNHP
jgi:predicted  nucleic acid-binding Zn-ribbon protein